MNLAQPGWLAVLLLLPLLGVGAVLASRLRRRQWAAFVAPRLRDALLKRGGPLPRWFALFFLLAACFAIAIALARPQGDAGTRVEKTQGRNVMIALDISKSMRVADVKPDRLSQAKVVIYELMEAMPNERIGLIAFAGTAFVHAPLTIDHAAVRETVDQIDETWAPLGGSDLAAAVHLATRTLKQTGQENNALVILSDGEENDGDLDEMIAEAKQSGVYIVTIGIGTEDGDYVPNPDSPTGRMLDRNGNTVISRIQPEVLRELAEDTKGRFAVAGSGTDLPQLVKSVTAGLDSFEMDGRQRRILIEFYQWLMLPAILFLMASIIAATRWRGIATAAAAMALIAPAPVRAGEADEARSQLAARDYDTARQSYHQLADQARSDGKRAGYRFGEGTAAYRGGDFRNARSAYSHSLLSEDPAVRAGAHLGLGNSLFQLGWKGLSGENYPAAPEPLPDLARFDTLVKEALAKLRESESRDEGDTSDTERLESLVTNWADAVRHFDSARQSGDETAEKNRRLTLTYLKRLEELLKQEEEQTAQAMPQPGPGQPQEGEGEGDEQDGEGDGKGKPGGKGRGGEERENGDGGDRKDKDRDGRNGDKDKKEGDRGENPNESPQERANRILKENSDLEKGPLAPGRREFRSAEKDW